MSKSKSFEEEEPLISSSIKSRSSSIKSRSSSKEKSSSIKSRSSSKQKSESIKSRSSSSRSSSNQNPENLYMEECETFIDVVSEVLARPNDISSSIYSTMSEDIKQTWNDYSISINIWNKHTGKSCAYIKYSAVEKIIHIVEIEKCNDKILPEQGKGTDIIKKLIAVGNNFRHKLNPSIQLKIMVDDDASILYIKKIEYDLKWIYIFATGESWYNSLGFREAEYAANSDIVNQFIDKPYDDDDDNETIREHFSIIKRNLRNPTISIELLKDYKTDLTNTIKEFKRFEQKMIREDKYEPGFFHTKFENIIYEFPVSGVGFGIKRNKKSKNKSRKIKKSG